MTTYVAVCISSPGTSTIDFTVYAIDISSFSRAAVLRRSLAWDGIQHSSTEHTTAVGWLKPLGAIQRADGTNQLAPAETSRFTKALLRQWCYLKQMEMFPANQEGECPDHGSPAGVDCCPTAAAELLRDHDA